MLCHLQEEEGEKPKKRKKSSGAKKDKTPAKGKARISCK
jgi:hypothetical protein